nr:chaperonin-like RBCX protein 1, chloroplastic isoform X1 [Ipomoea trifida]
MEWKHSCCRAGYGVSPEKRAANHLHDFFNFIAVKIVVAQLQRYNREAYQELMEFLERNSLNDGDKFCEKLMRESPRHKKLALRIMEVRSAYCKDDFEWEHLSSLSSKVMNSPTPSFFSMSVIAPLIYL